MTKQEVTYKFQQTSIDEFSLVLRFKPDNALISKALFLTTKRVKKEKGIDLTSNVGELEKSLEHFVLPPAFNNLFGTFSKKVFKNIFREVEQDGIIVIRHNVNNVYFEKANEVYFIVFECTGHLQKNEH